MASFTDQTNIQYTPYIETNPTDAYLKVGMYKEQQLQAGIQKVQQTVDTLTGLPIIKDEDKQYLQNKISSLKTGITKNLSGDFSDSRIVNQIAGAAKSIYSDPIVQNSVQGTMSYKKGLADIEQAKKDGKWNVANETVFQDEVNRWLGDKTVGSKSSQYFTGYTPYTDVNAEFLKYWKETNPTEDMSNAYYTDASGKTAINPVLFKGKTPAQIQSVWNLVKGNANVQQQLGIDGKYQFRGQTPEAIYNQLGVQTKASIDENNKAILNLQAKAATGNTEASAQIEQLKKFNIDAEKSLAEYAQALQTNPDAVKSAITSQRTLSSLIGAYTYQTMEKSPLWETSFQENKFRIETEQWQRTFDFNREKFGWDKQMDMLKYSLDVEKNKKDKQALEGIINPAAVDPTETVKDENTARQAIALTQEKYTQEMRELAYSLAGAGSQPYIKDPLTNQWVPNVGPGKPYATKYDADLASQTLVAAAKDKYINGNLDGRPGEIMERAEGTYKNLQAAQKRVNDVEAAFAPQIAQIAQTLKEDIGDMQLAQDFVRAYTVNSKAPGWESAEIGLKQKYGEQWRSGMGIYGGQASEDPNQGGLVAPDKSTYANVGVYQKVASKLKSNPTFSNILQAKDNEYKRKQSTEVGYDVTLNTIDSKTKEQARNIYSSIVGAVTSLNSSSTKGEFKDFEAMLSGKPGEIDQNIYSHYLNPITQQGSITIKRGGESVSIPVPASVILQHWPESSTFSGFREKFQTSLDLNNGMTTDDGGGFASAFKANQGPVSPYVVKYHVNNNGDGTYSLKWWVGAKPKQGETSTPLIIPGETVGEKYGIPSAMSEEQIMSVINQMKQKEWVDKAVTLYDKLKQ